MFMQFVLYFVSKSYFTQLCSIFFYKIKIMRALKQSAMKSFLSVPSSENYNSVQSNNLSLSLQGLDNYSPKTFSQSSK